jgi:protein FAM50
MIGSSKFIPQNNDAEAELKMDTVGLVALEDFVKIRKTIQKEEALGIPKKPRLDEEPVRPVVDKKKKKSKILKSKLSFDPDDPDTCPVTASPLMGKKLVKNPNVNTSFLPDKDREDMEKCERQRLEKEWIELQEKIKGRIFFISIHVNSFVHRGNNECGLQLLRWIQCSQNASSNNATIMIFCDRKV